MPYKNNIFRFTILSFVFILFSNADCSKQKTEPTCFISDEFKSYTIFGIGSYWIYQDIEGVIDTVTITDIERLIIEDVEGIYPHEKFEVTKNSSIHGFVNQVAVCKAQSGALDCKDSFSIYSISKHHDAIFFCCCNEGKKFEELTYIGKDNIIINNESFTGALHFKMNSSNPLSFRTLYYVKDIGLVKYEDYNNNQWEIIEYSIIEY